MVAYRNKRHGDQNTQQSQIGFTIVELLIVISVIGIIMGFVFAYLPGSQLSARDSERKSDTETIARYFEQKYTTEASAMYPTYPSTTSLASAITELTDKGFDEAPIAPRQDSSSIIAASNTANQNAIVDSSTYIYQPFSPDGSLCTSSSAALPCVRFTLWYQLETDNEVEYIESRHQQ